MPLELLYRVHTRKLHEIYIVKSFFVMDILKTLAHLVESSDYNTLLPSSPKSDSNS